MVGATEWLLWLPMPTVAALALTCAGGGRGGRWHLVSVATAAGATLLACLWGLVELNAGGWAARPPSVGWALIDNAFLKVHWALQADAGGLALVSLAAAAVLALAVRGTITAGSSEAGLNPRPARRLALALLGLIVVGLAADLVLAVASLFVLVMALDRGDEAGPETGEWTTVTGLAAALAALVGAAAIITYNQGDALLGSLAQWAGSDAGPATNRLNVTAIGLMLGAPALWLGLFFPVVARNMVRRRVAVDLPALLIIPLAAAAWLAKNDFLLCRVPLLGQLPWLLPTVAVAGTVGLAIWGRAPLPGRVPGKGHGRWERMGEALNRLEEYAASRGRTAAPGGPVAAWRGAPASAAEGLDGWWPVILALAALGALWLFL